MESPTSLYENDEYSPAIVDDLLRGLNEWRNIQDIVRLTFKALSDVVRTQGQAIHDLERQMILKINKNEFNVEISRKVNSSEIAEIQEALEARVPYLDYQMLSEEKVSRSDIQYLLANKPSVEEVKMLIEGKANSRDVNSELDMLKSHIDDICREINRKITQIPNEREMDFLHSQLKDKVSQSEFREALELKANKQMVSTALQSKLDRFSFDELLSEKKDFGDMQRVLAALESKADYSLFEQLNSDLQNKIDRSDFTHILLPEISKKAEKFEIELLIKDLRSHYEKTFLEHSATTSAYISSLTADLDQSKRSLASSLAKKPDIKDLEKLYGLLTKKADLDVSVDLIEKTKNDVRELLIEFKRDIKKAEDFDFKHRFENEILRIKEELDLIHERMKELSSDQINYARSLAASIKVDLQREANKMLEQLTLDHISTRVDPADFNSLKQLLTEAQRSITKVSEATVKMNEDFKNALKATKEETESTQKVLESTLTRSLSLKADTNDIPNLISRKLEDGHTVKQLGIKSVQSDLHSLKEEIEKIHIDLLRKSNAADLDSHIKSFEFALEDIAKDLLQKCNIKDVCTLLDLKPNIDDINKALSDIHKELDQRIHIKDFSGHLTNYNSTVELLCSENHLGRWLWKSGELKSGSIVPWEIQTVNTAPENFLWERDKGSITTVTPGLYELILGFYSRKKPTIQILVNGEPIISAVNSSSYVVHHSSGKLKPVSIHSNGNIAGLTLIDFIALPARARVSIGYTGEIHCEGFLGLRKL